MRENWTIDDTRYWTVVRSGSRSSENYEFTGALLQHAIVSLVVGDSRLDVKSTASASETEGWRKPLDGGYEREVVTSGASLTHAQTINGTAITIAGVILVGDPDVTQRTTDRSFVNTNHQKRWRDGSTVYRYDRDTRDSLTVTLVTPSEGDATHIVRWAFEEKIDSSKRYPSAEFVGTVVETTDVERVRSSTYTLSGNRESLRSNERSVDEKRTVTQWVNAHANGVNRYRNTDTTTTTIVSRYSSSHTLDDDGLASGGIFLAGHSHTVKHEVDSFSRTVGVGNFGGTDFVHTVEDTKNTTTINSHETSELGSYYDAAELGSVRRVTAGLYTRSISSSRHIKNHTDDTHDFETGSDWTVINETDSLRTTLQRYEGQYGPDGGREEMTNDDLDTHDRTIADSRWAWHNRTDTRSTTKRRLGEDPTGVEVEIVMSTEAPWSVTITPYDLGGARHATPRELAAEPA